MNVSRDVRGRNAWGRRAQANLFLKFNCPEATMQTCQDMIGRQEDTLLQAVSGLLGGVVCRGSTCGVVSGGALGLALMHEEALRKDGPEAEVGLISMAGDYVRWFGETYGTILCRERSGVDFWSLGGLLRYLLPGDRMLRCLAHGSGAMKYLHDRQNQSLTPVDLDQQEKEAKPIHCAQAVLEAVRTSTAVGDPLLERLSIVLDGGVGLQGGACGALAAAVLAINILVGMDLRRASPLQAYAAFLTGTRYLRTDRPTEERDPYDVGKTIVLRFEKEAGSIDCRTITGQEFSDWVSFQSHMNSSEKCRNLIALSIREAISAIERHDQVGMGAPPARMIAAE